MNFGKRSRIWGLFGLFLFLPAIYCIAKNLHDVERIIEHMGFAGPVVIILLYGIFAATPITTDPLTVISGALFGPTMGIVISWIGNNIASMVEYYLGKQIGTITNFKTLKQKLPFGLSNLPVSSPWFLVFGRLIPGYGGKVISFMGGIYHVPLGVYLWTTALTNFFGSLLLSLGGYHIIRLLKF